jgi:hypothetical protein
MEVIEVDVCPPDEAGGFSVVTVEQVLTRARILGVEDQWRSMWVGNPSGRKIVYQPEQRMGAIGSTLSCGLRGAVRPCGEGARDDRTRTSVPRFEKWMSGTAKRRALK